MMVNNQLILEEDFDENYVPTEDEVREYAKCIGIDTDKEPHLLWIAKEGINVPLPENWKPCQDSNGELYYFNFASGESIWDHPCDASYKKMVVDERRRHNTEIEKETKKRKPSTSSHRNQTGKMSANLKASFLFLYYDGVPGRTGAPDQVDGVRFFRSRNSGIPTHTSGGNRSSEVGGRRAVSGEVGGAQKPVDIHCDPCKETHAKAVGYCQNCAEYLCDTCYNVHTIPTPLKHHVLLDASKMPRQRID